MGSWRCEWRCKGGREKGVAEGYAVATVGDSGGCRVEGLD